MTRLSSLIKRAPVSLRERLVESLYVEAMVLADEAYACFAAERPPLDANADPVLRVAYACESLKTTTRLMHVIAWLLNQRAIFAGETVAGGDEMALGAPVPVDWRIAVRFPETVRTMMAASERLFERVAGLESAEDAAPAPPPVRGLMQSLAARF